MHSPVWSRNCSHNGTWMYVLSSFGLFSSGCLQWLYETSRLTCSLFTERLHASQRGFESAARCLSNRGSGESFQPSGAICAANGPIYADARVFDWITQIWDRHLHSAENEVTVSGTGTKLTNTQRLSFFNFMKTSFYIVVNVVGNKYLSSFTVAERHPRTHKLNAKAKCCCKYVYISTQFFFLKQSIHAFVHVYKMATEIQTITHTHTPPQTHGHTRTHTHTDTHTHTHVWPPISLHLLINTEPICQRSIKHTEAEVFGVITTNTHTQT